MRVTEIFFSIQGEGTRAGLPCVFVRLTGCDLRCNYCDTAYAFTGGREASREEILAEVARHPCKLVLLTGGEPMLQRELPDLARELQEYVKHHTAPHKYPRAVLFVDVLPKTATGKIQRFRLREQENGVR